MNFGDFYKAVSDHLKNNHNWGAPASYLHLHPELINIIYAHYEQNKMSPQEAWPGIIETTALLVERSSQHP